MKPEIVVHRMVAVREGGRKCACHGEAQQSKGAFPVRVRHGTNRNRGGPGQYGCAGESGHRGKAIRGWESLQHVLGAVELAGWGREAPVLWELHCKQKSLDAFRTE